MWLIEINCAKLPSNGDVLRRLFYITSDKTSAKEAASIVYSEIFQIWDKAKIPVREKRNVVPKILKFITALELYKKTKSMRHKKQIENETQFKDCLNDLFDIAHLNALQMMTIEEDRLFLQAQREKGRRGYICTVDNKLAAIQSRKRKREDGENKRIRSENLRKTEHADRVVELSDTSASANASSNDDQPGPSCSKTVLTSKKKKIVTPDLAMAL